MHQSSYETTPFAQSMFQRTAPMNAYPTPPPAGVITNSSSSLAYALGRPSPQPSKVHLPAESPAFFDNFLVQKSREMNASGRPTTPPPRLTAFVNQESPDPLALSTEPSMTPRKRKMVVQIESPAVKRVQSVQSFHIPSAMMPRTPVQKSSSTPQMTTTTPRRNLAYVAVPPKPWLTPKSSHNGSGSHMSNKQWGKLKSDGGSPDLGGYGSEDDDDGAYSPTRTNDVVKSSSRRTGDRDERGKRFPLFDMFNF